MLYIYNIYFIDTVYISYLHAYRQARNHTFDDSECKPPLLILYTISYFSITVLELVIIEIHIIIF